MGGIQRRISQQVLVPESAVISIEVDPTRGGVSSSGIPIPIREEFRVRRLWFFHHDIRAFATSVGSTIF